MRIVEGVRTIQDVEAFLGDLASIGEDYGTMIQAFDARYVAGQAHLAAAVDCATRAFERDDAIAEDRAVEILCYAAGRRQIERALEMGVDEGQNAVVVVLDGGDESAAAAAVDARFEHNDVHYEGRDETLIQEFFGITDEERRATDATLCDLVVERVCLLAVEK